MPTQQKAHTHTYSNTALHTIGIEISAKHMIPSMDSGSIGWLCKTAIAAYDPVTVITVTTWHNTLYDAYC
jgi:hypothetical protein